MTVEFSPAPEIAVIASELISQHHPYLANPQVRIEYVFRHKTKDKQGKRVLGEARKVTNLNAYLASHDGSEWHDTGEPFFAIVICSKSWDTMTAKQRRALVDHELCHLWVETDEETGEITLSLLPHDVEEFQQIVNRHGLWQQEVQEFVRAGEPHLHQIPLPFSRSSSTGSAVESIGDAVAAAIERKSRP